MLLPKQHLLYSKLMENMIGDGQFQPAGIDITLKEAYEFTGPGKIDFDNSERKISEVRPVPYQSDNIRLGAGCYKVIFNEYVKIPQDLAAFCLPRSSLLRCGATLEFAVWAPGYEGGSEALLLVSNPHGITL